MWQISMFSSCENYSIYRFIIYLFFILKIKKVNGKIIILHKYNLV